MPNKCFVPGCKTGYTSDAKRLKLSNEKKPILFSSPEDEKTLEVLNNSIPRGDKKLKQKDHVCSLHFDTDSIIKFDEFEMDNRENEERERLLSLKSRGFLLVPSKNLYEIIYQLEDAICKILTSTKLHKNLLFEILEYLEANNSNIKSIGCNEHGHSLAKSITAFYLQCRMHFACTIENTAKEKNKNKKNLAKQSKL